MFDAWKKSRQASQRRRHSCWRMKAGEEEEKGAAARGVPEAMNGSKRRSQRFPKMVGYPFMVLGKGGLTAEDWKAAQGRRRGCLTSRDQLHSQVTM